MKPDVHTAHEVAIRPPTKKAFNTAQVNKFFRTFLIRRPYFYALFFTIGIFANIIVDDGIDIIWNTVNRGRQFDVIPKLFPNLPPNTEPEAKPEEAAEDAAE